MWCPPTFSSHFITFQLLTVCKSFAEFVYRISGFYAFLAPLRTSPRKSLLKPDLLDLEPPWPGPLARLQTPLYRS